MKRASKSIALMLIASASILQGCDDRNDSSQESSVGDWPAESPLLANSPYQSTTRPSVYNPSRSYSHSGGSHLWFPMFLSRYSSGSSYGGSGVYNHAPSGGGVSGSASHATARGGFGATGHAASGGGA